MSKKLARTLGGSGTVPRGDCHGRPRVRQGGGPVTLPEGTGKAAVE